ncbi:sigma-70 family RNA polymerase sigma factor [Bythopirellula polymerisocia]|uniref:ECF RNA polymerase sigma factor SigW n=1 Tax=Bythopirellula polymerisocia TaxID=2528003 RepID=A0A5C6D1E8_9BACT|nr:sigma-70 family RNA polymerase sigma factor [Bythopirellula polymerisocia]TWU29654.1 ECF RNA polymerase sigma factor SigW [Bythopirellula polymerisocia]
MEPIATTRPNRRNGLPTGNASAAVLDIPPTDGELLMRYRCHGDEEAFTELVEKHGPMVWTLCWQILRHHQDREDAFQATFLILAKRADTIRECDSLAGWLYRVAYRTALRARLAARNKPTLDLGSDIHADIKEQLASVQAHEQRSILLEELHALPQRYQLPLVLCYLQGNSRREVAEELGCTLETVKGRLARGRQLLRQRLIRRGVSLSLAMSAMSLPVKSALAAVTPQLIGGTVAGCEAWSSGSAQISNVSQHALHLAQQGATAMTIASIAKPAMLVAVLLTAATASVAVESASRDHSLRQASSAAIDLQADAVLRKDSEPVEKDIAIESVAAVEAAASQSPPAPTPSQPTPPRAPVIKHEHVEVHPPAPIAPPALVPQPNFTSPLPPQVVSKPNLGESRFSSNVELQRKLAESEGKILGLQLKAKEFEIDALDHEGHEREKLMEQSRKYLLRAEAESLKVQLERQLAMLEELKHLPETRAQAVQAWPQPSEDDKTQLMRALAKSDEALAKSRQIEMRLREEVQQAVIEAQEKYVVAQKQALTATTHAMSAAQGATNHPQFPFSPQDSNASTPVPTFEQPRVQKLQLQPGDQIKIQVSGALPDSPLDYEYTVEQMGTVPLGVMYGRVKVAGLTVIEAEEAIREHLSKTLTDPKVQVVLSAKVPVYFPAAPELYPSPAQSLNSSKE